MLAIALGESDHELHVHAIVDAAIEPALKV